MICRKMQSEYKNLLPDLLLDREQVPAAVRTHVEQCADCMQELKALEGTMLALDAWEGTEPSPFFDARIAARMRLEREAQPAGFLERMRVRFLYSSNLHLRPVAAGVFALLLLLGGGTYAGLSFHSTPAVNTSATIQDLQSLDNNAQLFQQLDSLDQQDNSAGNGSASR